MRRHLFGTIPIVAIVTLLAWLIAAPFAHAQYPGPQGPMMFSANCSGSPNFGTAYLCFDTTVNTFYYWLSGSGFQAISQAQTTAVFTEQAAPAGQSGKEVEWGDSTAHTLKVKNNGSSTAKYIVEDTNTIGSGVVPDGSGTNAELASSSITDNGTNVTTTETLSAGTATTGITAGDVSASRAAGTGEMWFGSNGSQSLDFGIGTASKFTLTGGPLLNIGGSVTAGLAGTTQGNLVSSGSTAGTWTLAAAANTTGSWTLTAEATAPTQGDLFTFSNGTGTMASVADVAAGSVLGSAGTSTAPAYVAQITLTGVGTGLETSATTAYFFPNGNSAATTTEGSAEIAAPRTMTFTKIWCGMSASNGSGTSDAFSLIDASSACAGLTCTASNAKTCNSVAGSCAVTAGDLITIQDITTSTPTARQGTCEIAP